ncbi:MAG: hypothetical protein PHT60_15060 [Acidiphilium sp.]|nr:hypothetical protein [Acidiphilium sp.]
MLFHSILHAIVYGAFFDPTRHLTLPQVIAFGVIVSGLVVVLPRLRLRRRDYGRRW